MKYDIFTLPTASPNPGKTLFLLGTSQDGPINTPIPIRNIREAETIFGSIEYGDLVRAYEEASRVEEITIYLMRITGQSSRGSIQGNLNAQKEKLLDFRSIYGGEDYNLIRTYVAEMPRGNGKEMALVIEIPTFKMRSRLYFLNDYDNMEHLVKTINVESSQGQNLVFASTEFPMESPLLLNDSNETPVNMEGGEDGLAFTRDELYIALDDAYSLLAGREIDIICPVTPRFDDSHPGYYFENASEVYPTYEADRDYLALIDTYNNDRLVTFHEQLIAFCKQQEGFGIMTHGVIGLREIDDLEDLTRHSYPYVTRLAMTTAMSNRYGLIDSKGDGEFLDKGCYLTIFAHDFVYFQGEDTEYFANGAPLYAALLAGTGDDDTTTNKPLPEGIKLRYEYSQQEMEQLAFLGITTARDSLKYGPVIYAGVTAALFTTPLHFVANVRTVQYTMNLVNIILDDMIGEPYIPVLTQRDITRKVDNVLKTLKERGVIRDYRLSVDYNSAQNQGYIYLDILAKFAIEYISTGASVLFAGRRGV